MNRCPKCGGTLWHPSLSRGPLDPPYCTCSGVRTITTDHTEPLQLAIQDIQAAISYAPLGTRDSAAYSLRMITDPRGWVDHLLVQEAQLKVLRDYAYWATYALLGIEGSKKMVCSTHEAEARAFLDTHAKVVNELFPHVREHKDES